MANFFTRFLSGVGDGITNPKGLVNNWEHATRLFIDDSYRLSPRTKFLYYARFELDKTAVKAPAFTNKHSEEFGLLIRSADLPKFTFDSVVKNQYNRKKLLYKQINYDPVTINMRDDSAGVVNALWALYYGYYIADRLNPNAAYGATHLRPTGTGIDNYRYGMDNSISTPFFKSISIYTMSRRRFNGYTLINPRIKSWQHGSMDYSASDFNESTMTLEYEAVKYSTGSCYIGNPKGFATLHYDTVPSPLTIAGGGLSNLTGEGGVLDGLEQIFGDIGSGATFDSFGGFLSTAIKSINTYKNAKNLTAASLKNEAINILAGPGGGAGIVSTVGGVLGSVFPSNAGNNNSTTATARNILGL
jgi:hypothetical protein